MPKAVRANTRKTHRRTEAVERPGRVTRSQLKPQLTIKTPVPPNSTTRRKRKIPTLPLYTRSQKEISADSNRLLPLFRLPREIIQDIATNHLPLDSASSEYAKKGCHGPQIDLLAGDYTVDYPILGLSWQVTSKGRRVDGNLIVQHIHTLQTVRDYNDMRGKKDLYAVYILALPIRLCPHQSTVTTGPHAPSCYIKSKEKNSPQFTHAITTAFPTTRRETLGGTHIPQQTMNNAFSKPTPRELEAMNAADAGNKNILWCCRSCPTKYRVEFGGGKLKILAWHSFGRDQLHASKYWKWFVRREGKLLGMDKRNDEWWSPARTVPNFEIGEGEWEDDSLGTGKEL
ncbi:hypothetical protein A1F97_01400 [Pyrenophora tritici-repentis]|nr:hypothetical protein A1F96_01869 [Pyrenophora tritici-repentis]PZD45462.1 hypothetical protein A1F97_01400 [Pyrenophora tritici-repentis]